MIRRMGVSGIAVGAALLAVGVPGALAKPGGAVTTSALRAESSPCAAQSYVQAFAPFGDANLYSLAPQGSFETGYDGWTVTGSARLVADPAYPGGPASDTASLELAPGATATSPPICANATTPMFRFFAKAASAGQGELGIDVFYPTTDGGTAKGGTSMMLGDAWALSPQIEVKTNKIAVDASGWGAIQVVIRAPNDRSVRVDDIYVDPRLR